MRAFDVSQLVLKGYAFVTLGCSLVALVNGDGPSLRAMAWAQNGPTVM
jgi:hypothetical protein